MSAGSRSQRKMEVADRRQSACTLPFTSACTVGSPLPEGLEGIRESNGEHVQLCRCALLLDTWQNMFEIVHVPPSCNRYPPCPPVLGRRKCPRLYCGIARNLGSWSALPHQRGLCICHRRPPGSGVNASALSQSLWGWRQCQTRNVPLSCRSSGNIPPAAEDARIEVKNADAG